MNQEGARDTQEPALPGAGSASAAADGSGLGPDVAQDSAHDSAHVRGSNHDSDHDSADVRDSNHDSAHDSESAGSPWWRDRRRRNRAVVIAFAVLAVGGILFPAFSNYLFAGDQRVLVVTLANGAGQDKREGLKQACGALPGISVVADRGNPDPRIQGRFPVRFNIADTTTQQESALLACLNDNMARFSISGYLPEKDGN